MSSFETMVPLSLEETGVLCHLMMGEAIKQKRNPILNPKSPDETRLQKLYLKLSKANDEMMGRAK